MALEFPDSPLDGNTFVSNNVTYVYSETKGVWYSLLGNVVSGGGGASGGASVTIATSPPGSPSEGDLYWDEELGKLFIYYTDNDTSQWVETSGTGVINGGTVAGVASVNGEDGNVILTTTEVDEGNNLYFTNARAVGSLTAGESISIDSNGLVTVSVTEIDLSAVEQNIIPAANITYSLGNVTHRWKDIYLSGDTIVLGDVAIKTSNGSIGTTTVEANGYIVPGVVEVGAASAAATESFNPFLLIGV